MLTFEQFYNHNFKVSQPNGGWIQPKITPAIKDLIDGYRSSNLLFVSHDNKRQSGVTTSALAYLIWSAMYNANTNVELRVRNNFQIKDRFEALRASIGKLDSFILDLVDIVESTNNTIKFSNNSSITISHIDITPCRYDVIVIDCDTEVDYAKFTPYAGKLIVVSTRERSKSLNAQASDAMKNITILDASRLTADNSVICKVDSGNLPPHRVQELYSGVKDALLEKFSPAKVIVMSSKSDITII